MNVYHALISACVDNTYFILGEKPSLSQFIYVLLEYIFVLIVCLYHKYIVGDII